MTEHTNGTPWIEHKTAAIAWASSAKVMWEIKFDWMRGENVRGESLEHCEVEITKITSGRRGKTQFNTMDTKSADLLYANHLNSGAALVTSRDWYSNFPKES